LKEATIALLRVVAIALLQVVDLQLELILQQEVAKLVELEQLGPNWLRLLRPSTRLHPNLQSQKGSLLRTLRSYHKQSRPQLLYALENRVESVC